MFYKRDKIGRFASKNGGGAGSDAAAHKQARTKQIRSMTDEEIRASMNRLTLEKQYRTLLNEVNPPPTSKSEEAAKFVGRVLMKSGEATAEKVVTHLMGKAINKALDADVISIAKSATALKAEQKKKDDADKFDREFTLRKEKREIEKTEYDRAETVRKEEREDAKYVRDMLEKIRLENRVDQAEARKNSEDLYNEFVAEMERRTFEGD